ncbi:MAG: TonB-dependent receptor, partial [Bacteroidota bacterium]
IRVYGTTENSGDSYDAFLTALLLQRAAKDDQSWAQDYSNHWNTTYSSSIRGLAGFPLPSQYPVYTDYLNAINPFLYDQYGSLMQRDHDETRGYADNHVSATGQYPRFEPGTLAFDSAFKAITTTIYDYKSTNPGSGLYDRSSLYHAHGEYRFKPSFAEVVVGANTRLYRPDSKGTIFRDTGNVIIKNEEVGVYAGIEKKVAAEKLKLNLTARLDKNRNFDYLVSPAASEVFTPNELVTSASTPIR